jgi:hypothetical protein
VVGKAHPTYRSKKINLSPFCPLFFHLHHIPPYSPEPPHCVAAVYGGLCPPFLSGLLTALEQRGSPRRRGSHPLTRGGL